MFHGRWLLSSRWRRRSTFLICLSVIVMIILYFITFNSHSHSIEISAPTASFKLKPIRAVPADAHINSQGGKTLIPRIIHQTWKSEDSLPETFRLWMESWLSHNDDWSYWLWTDEDMRRFMEVVFPQYLTLYDSYPTQGYRADAFRLELFAQVFSLINFF